jgi:hypothetical protein
MSVSAELGNLRAKPVVRLILPEHDRSALPHSNRRCEYHAQWDEISLSRISNRACDYRGRQHRPTQL